MGSEERWPTEYKFENYESTDGTHYLYIPGKIGKQTKRTLLTKSGRVCERPNIRRSRRQFLWPM